MLPYAVSILKKNNVKIFYLSFCINMHSDEYECSYKNWTVAIIYVKAGG